MLKTLYKYHTTTALLILANLFGVVGFVPAATADRLSDVTAWYAAMDGSDGTVALFADQISVLRGDHAIRSGSGLGVSFVENFEPKGSYIKGWTNNSQSFSWNVTVDMADEFHIQALMFGRSHVELEITISGGKPLTFTIPEEGWRRHDLGKIKIPAGTSKLTIKSTAAEFGQMELKSLELKPDSAKAAIDRDIANSLSKSDWLAGGKLGAMFQWGPWGGNSDGSSSSFPDVYRDFPYQDFTQQMADMVSKKKACSTPPFP